MKIRNNIAVSESGFVFDPSTGESFTLNKTGQEIISLVKQGMDYEQILNSLLANYDGEKPLYERYLVEFFEELRNFNLLEE